MKKFSELKVGDRVRNTNKGGMHYNNEGVVVEILENTCLCEFQRYKVSCHKENLEKIELPKEEKEPFELKEGMKFVRNDGIKGSYIFSSVISNRVYDTNGDYHFKTNIDWEATRKINEVKEEPFKLKKGMRVKILLDERVGFDYIEHLIEVEKANKAHNIEGV